MGDPHYFATMPSPVGELTLVASDHGLRAILWPDDDDRVPLPEAMLEQQDRPMLTDAKRQLTEYFEGSRTEFDLPLDLRGTEFQKAAWQALADIPYGTTASYAESRRRASADRQLCGQSARPTDATRSRSCCRATGWSAATGRSPDSLGVSTANNCSSSTREHWANRRCP